MSILNKRPPGEVYGDLTERRFECGFRTAKLRGRPDDEVVQLICNLCGSWVEKWRSELWYISWGQVRLGNKEKEEILPFHYLEYLALNPWSAPEN